MRRGAFVIALWLALAPACAHRWEPVAPDPTPALDAARVVLLDETRLDYHLEHGEAVGDDTRHFRGQVLAPEATRWEQVSAVYNRAWSELLALHGRVVHRDGSSEDADEAKKSERPAAQSFELYDDARLAVLPVPAAAVGEVWESLSTVRERDPRTTATEVVLQRVDPIALHRVVVTVPPGWQIETAWRFAQPQAFITQTLADGSTRYTLERRDVPVMQKEALAADWPPHLMIRLKSWVDGSGHPQGGYPDVRALSAGLWTQMKSSDVSNAEIDAEAEKISRTVGHGIEAQVRAAHLWVCEKIQYCAIEIGLGGWVPHRAAEVQRLGYGDCKDKAMLLHVLLAKLGVPSELALIYSHRGVPLPFGLPTVTGNFNHAILKVELPGRSVLTDPTAEFVPFGELPPNDLDADVLPLAAEGATLERSPGQTASVDELNTALSLRLSDGRLEGTAAVTALGGFANEWRARLSRLPAPERAHAWCTLYGDHCQLSDTHTLGLEKGADRVEALARVELAGVVERTPTFWSLRPHALGDWGFDAPRGRQRTQPIVLHAPCKKTQTVDLGVGPDDDAQLPAPVRLDAGFALYSLAWERTPASVNLVRSLEWRTWVVPPERYEDVAAFSAAVRAAEARAVVVKPGVSR